jgi:uncharacterized protein YodC (DUF2158 family)
MSVYHRKWDFSEGEKTKMAEQFKSGDVVCLKSGGPSMTVEQSGLDGFGKPRVWCDWFDGKKKISDTFSPESLEIAER